MKRLVVSLIAVLAVVAVVPAIASAAQPDGVGDVPGCNAGGDPGPFIRAENPHAWIMRVIFSDIPGDSQYDPGRATCMADALAEHYDIYLTIQWNGSDSVPAAVAWIKRVLNDHTYAQGCCYIVGIGNEENNMNVSASTYKSIYDQVAPIADKDSYGFIAAPELNWNTSWLSSWMKSEGGHPPDLSIVSGHAYPGLVSEPGYARALESYGYYVAFSEGVCGGSRTWEQYGALPYSQALNLGPIFNLEWAATNGSAC